MYYSVKTTLKQKTPLAVADFFIPEGAIKTSKKDKIRN